MFIDLFVTFCSFSTLDSACINLFLEIFNSEYNMEHHKRINSKGFYFRYSRRHIYTNNSGILENQF